MTLVDVIDRLYAAFSEYELHIPIPVCAHCGSQHEFDVLAFSPLRSLSCAQLSRSAFKAMTTWGGPDDYRHFLPRILELAATPAGSGLPGMSFDLIADKLDLAGWPSWAHSEQQAVTDYLLAIWYAVLEDDPENGFEASDLLPAIARTVTDVSVFLRMWEADLRGIALLQLAGIIESNWSDVAKTGHLGERWRGGSGCDVVERWLLDSSRRRSLEAALEQCGDDPVLGDRLSAGISAYGWMKEGAR